MLGTLLATHDDLGSDDLRSTVSHDVMARLRSALIAALIERDTQAVQRVANILGVADKVGRTGRALLFRPPDGVGADSFQRRAIAGLEQQGITVVADGIWNWALVVVALEPATVPPDSPATLDALRR